MKSKTLAIALVATMLATVPLCHAGWVKDFGRSAGKVTRTATDKGKAHYKKTKRMPMTTRENGARKPGIPIPEPKEQPAKHEMVFMKGITEKGEDGNNLQTPQQKIIFPHLEKGEGIFLSYTHLTSLAATVRGPARFRNQAPQLKLTYLTGKTSRKPELL